TLEDVVCEEHADLVAADEALCQAERLGDAARLFLVGVEEPVDAPLVAVAEQAEELARVRPAGDEHDLVDAGTHERLDPVRDHGTVIQGQQVLVRDPRQRMEPRACAAGEDDALHRAILVGRPGYRPFAAAERYGRKGGAPRRHAANGITGGPEARGAAPSEPPSR